MERIGTGGRVGQLSVDNVDIDVDPVLVAVLCNVPGRTVQDRMLAVDTAGGVGKRRSSELHGNHPRLLDRMGGGGGGGMTRVSVIGPTGEAANGAVAHSIAMEADAAEKRRRRWRRRLSAISLTVL